MYLILTQDSRDKSYIFILTENTDFTWPSRTEYRMVSMCQVTDLISSGFPVTHIAEFLTYNINFETFICKVMYKGYCSFVVLKVFNSDKSL